MNLSSLQEGKLKYIIAGLGALGGIVAVLVFLDQKKHNQVQRELFALDKEIKILQLQKIKNGNT